jgi:hypothetical protein
VANNGGRVYGITLTGSPGSYDYLSIYSSHRSVHTVRYNSEYAPIVAFKWSNYSFSW